jgi:hypothetical protein
MRTATIIPSDNIICIDGEGVTVDCSSVDEVIHAIQWNSLQRKGAIEFVDDDPHDGFKEPNKIIDSIQPWQLLINEAIAGIEKAKVKRAEQQAAFDENKKRLAAQEAEMAKQSAALAKLPLVSDLLKKIK